METVDDLGGMGYPGQVYGLGGGVTLDCGHVIPVTQCGKWGHTGHSGVRGFEPQWNPVSWTLATLHCLPHPRPWLLRAQMELTAEQASPEPAEDTGHSRAAAPGAGGTASGCCWAEAGPPACEA